MNRYQEVKYLQSDNLKQFVGWSFLYEGVDRARFQQNIYFLSNGDDEINFDEIDLGHLNSKPIQSYANVLKTGHNYHPCKDKIYTNHGTKFQIYSYITQVMQYIIIRALETFKLN